VTDAELRALVRDAVRRRLGQALPAEVPARAQRVVPLGAGSAFAEHPSHLQYLALVNATDACVIEPSVSCDHCGYCKSHGH
jgi:hypothetical protein